MPIMAFTSASIMGSAIETPVFRPGRKDSLPVPSITPQPERFQPVKAEGTDTYQTAPVRQRSPGLEPTHTLYAALETGPGVHSGARAIRHTFRHMPGVRSLWHDGTMAVDYTTGQSVTPVVARITDIAMTFRKREGKRRWFVPTRVHSAFVTGSGFRGNMIPRGAASCRQPPWTRDTGAGVRRETVARPSVCDGIIGHVIALRYHSSRSTSLVVT